MVADFVRSAARWASAGVVLLESQATVGGYPVRGKWRPKIGPGRHEQNAE
jgi:hypothetical protein